MSDSDAISDRKSPGFWFYPSDFEKDVQMLSLAAQGLWIRMLGWMHENESHRGFLELPNGQPMNEKHIAAKVGKPVIQVRAALREMEDIGLYSRVGGSTTGGIYCRRMARDTHISTVRSEAAKSRANKAKRAENGSFAGAFAGANQPAKVQQNPAVTVSVSDSVSDSSIPEEVVNSSELSRPEIKEIVCVSRAPVVSDLNGHTSQRFEEFWSAWPRKQNRDAAWRAWLSIVSIEDESAVFGCLKRFLASGDVARGAIPNPDRWLFDQRRDGWSGDWPPAKSKPKRETTAEIIKRSLK